MNFLSLYGDQTRLSATFLLYLIEKYVGSERIVQTRDNDPFGHFILKTYFRHLPVFLLFKSVPILFESSYAFEVLIVEILVNHHCSNNNNLSDCLLRKGVHSQALQGRLTPTQFANRKGSFSFWASFFF